MSKTRLSKPLIITLYGFPGAGKSHFDRQLCASLGLVHIHDLPIRLFLLKNEAKENQKKIKQHVNKDDQQDENDHYASKLKTTDEKNENQNFKFDSKEI